jgi:large subunit ribosomal protein L11
MMIKLLVDGGEMKPGPTIAQALGPAGINIGQVITKVNIATKEFKGMKVPVALDVNTKTKTFEVKVFSPPTSALLKKEIAAEKASGSAKSVKVGNLSIEQVISVAKIKYANMIVSGFKPAVKSVIGSCVSSGILIENKDPKEVMKEVEKGVYDSEIKAQKTEISDEKRAALLKYFNDIKTKQELEQKKEAEKKAEEEAAKAAATAAAGKTATPAAGTAATAAKPGEAAKPAATPAAAGKPEAAKKK